jgi:hypothetical protein
MNPCFHITFVDVEIVYAIAVCGALVLGFVIEMRRDNRERREATSRHEEDKARAVAEAVHRERQDNRIDALEDRIKILEFGTGTDDTDDTQEGNNEGTA